MPAAQWQTEGVTATLPDLSEQTAIADKIDAEAEAFDQPARFRAAVARVLETAEKTALREIAHDLAASKLDRIMVALQHFSRPAMTLDALLVLSKGHRGQNLTLAALARRNGVRRQTFHERILRVAAFLGVTYRREKPHRSARTPAHSSAISTNYSESISPSNSTGPF